MQEEDDFLEFAEEDWPQQQPDPLLWVQTWDDPDDEFTRQLRYCISKVARSYCVKLLDRLNACLKIGMP